MDAEDLVTLYLNAHQAAGTICSRPSAGTTIPSPPLSPGCVTEGHPTDPTQWNAKLLREWIVYNQTRPAKRGEGTLSASAVNSLIRSVKAFSRWLAEEELVERDPFHRVKAPKVPRLVKPSPFIPGTREGPGHGPYQPECLSGRGGDLVHPRHGCASLGSLRVTGRCHRLEQRDRATVRQGPKRAVRPVLCPHGQGDAALPSPGTAGCGHRHSSSQKEGVFDQIRPVSNL